VAQGVAALRVEHKGDIGELKGSIGQPPQLDRPPPRWLAPAPLAEGRGQPVYIGLLYVAQFARGRFVLQLPNGEVTQGSLESEGRIPADAPGALALPRADGAPAEAPPGLVYSGQLYAVGAANGRFVLRADDGTILQVRLQGDR